MNCSVLIVDDSPILRMAIKKVVRLAGIEESNIREAANGADALDRLDEQVSDLVLLDLNMPVMNGEEFAEALNSKPYRSKITVVVVSTEANKNRLDHIKQLGVLETLRKPFEPEDLKRLIDKAIGVST
ncbi:MAG: response regulator [Planctomycetota bacterium]|jgi:CheY-like chemotaxis protein